MNANGIISATDAALIKSNVGIALLQNRESGSQHKKWCRNANFRADEPVARMSNSP